MIADLSATIAVLLSVSLATERLVTIVKTMFPALAVEKKTAAGETALAPDRPRRLALQALALAAAWTTASFMTGDGPGELTWNPFGHVQAGDLTIWVPIVAILASGGSAFWTQLLQYTGAVRDIAITRKASAGLDFRGRAHEMSATPVDSGRDPREGVPAAPGGPDPFGAAGGARADDDESDLLRRLYSQMPRHINQFQPGREA
jgi:hypothetical protein